MNLTTKIKTHVLITYSDSHHFITQQQHDILVNTPIEGMIKLEDAAIQAKNIAEILNLEKYYETYPEKKSQHYNEPSMNWKDIYQEIISGRTEKQESARQAMIRGMKKAIEQLESTGTAYKTHALLAEMERSLNLWREKAL